MKKWNTIGLILLLLLGLQWAVRACNRYTSEGMRLARSIQSAGLPVTAIQAKPEQQGQQTVAVDGEGFKLLIIHFGHPGQYKEFASLSRKDMERPETKADPNAPLIALWLKQPDMVISTVDRDKPDLEARLSGALPGFERLAHGRK